MPVKKSKSNGSSNGSVADFETINVALNSDPEPENLPPQPPSNEEQISNEIASRYLNSISLVADQVADEFWNRMDAAVAEAIVKQVPEKFIKLRFSTPQKNLKTVESQEIEGGKP